MTKRTARLAVQVREQIGRIERTLVSAEREQAGIGRTQREKIAHALRPTGQPQERIYGLVPFLVRYGPEVVGMLYDAIDPFDETSGVISIPSQGPNDESQETAP